ncbi:MAG TPA: uroporphyrinogen-III C-methyltransferase [Thermoanaerobaculia bacterium]|nr:uroporphyrinogen-III C-methyltransferase [Thermoanaerobaculia bacterium]
MSTDPVGANPAGGFVWLVGAGPGDPELLTRKAARILAAADVVFYDGLVSLDVLALAPQAQRFSVAKRAGGGGTAQESIHRLLVRAARRGKRVVRLKGGDPFVFGRGGEEALALAAAGVPFEVVPGISSALSAPELAGIPVTHRGLAAGFVVVAGHHESAYAPVLGGLLPQAATVVVLMGVATRGELAAFMLARGWEATTPAALLLAAATPQAHTWIGTLAELGEAEIPAALIDAPGTLVIGEVVALADVIGNAGADGRGQLPPLHQSDPRHGALVRRSAVLSGVGAGLTPARREHGRLRERSSR